MEDESASNSHDSICPICLGPFIQLSYLDHCLHQFCFNCILRWTKVVSAKNHTPPSSVKCPLCKTDNFSIIHGVDGDCFQRYYINHHNVEDCFILSKAHRYRLQSYYTQQGFLEDIFNIPQYWKSRKYNQPNNWLQTWLTREIQALTQEEDVEIIVHHIFGVVKPLWTSREQKLHINAPEKKQEEFKISVSEAVRPFLGARTDRFVYEIQLFLASGLNIEAYDAVYIQRLGWSSPGENTEVSQNELVDRTTVIPYLYIFDDDSDGNE
ncbi:uncharacterized protein LOC123922689 isoform X1 [Trifolium pratense]|uniref:uncharacterized protein LOC123922689 isoform X1 n=1 Tax=Trifolium pratense TaxID=57577 RepID=UPI001E697A6C|nr:uncharacterized protein LOC123922689 isoform X1 [Trifolium pratense]